MYRKILVAIDDSATARKALAAAIGLARLSGARLHLLHVVEDLAYVNGYETAEVYFRDVLPTMQRCAAQLLEIARQEVDAAGVAADCMQRTAGRDRVCDLVAAEARSSGADLIVLGSHGRHGVQRVLLGSDAEQVVRIAPVPVLVVRADTPAA